MGNTGVRERMKQYLLKWAVAGLIWPALYLASHLFIAWSQEWVLLFWPSSIVLMPLGAGPNELSYLIYVWTVGAVLNMLTYIILGLLIKFVITLKQRTDRENS